LAKTFGVSTLGVSDILGTYYYTYSTASLIAGVLLDRLGAKYVVSTGMAILGIGCLLFMAPQEGAGYLGRLLQGAGSAFAFTGAVYLASHGLPARRLATAIGVTQCVGMLGGTAGQLVVGRWIADGLSVPQFWGRTGVVVLLVAAGLWWITPKETPNAPHGKASGGILATYKIVFSNPQSYLCGLAAGLLFVPTTVGDMVWGVRFFQTDKSFSFSDAVFAISMVPLGWVFGCPLLGWLADRLGRRKPVYLGGAAIMLIGFVQLIYCADTASRLAHAVHPRCGFRCRHDPVHHHQGGESRRGQGQCNRCDQFLDVRVTAAIGPIFARRFGKTLGTSHRRGRAFQARRSFLDRCSDCGTGGGIDAPGDWAEFIRTKRFSRAGCLRAATRPTRESASSTRPSDRCELTRTRKPRVLPNLHCVVFIRRRRSHKDASRH
jgi:MFS family permease